MANTIPDLWPTYGLETDVLTPIAILRTQSTLLRQKTQGLLVGEVRVTTSEFGQSILSFDIVAPAINNYRYRLLSVQHTKEAIYPATVSAQGFRITENVAAFFPLSGSRTVVKPVDSKSAYSDKQFIDIVQEVLKAPETLALLQSLIVRSNEETSDSSAIDDENAEPGEEQEI